MGKASRLKRGKHSQRPRIPGIAESPYIDAFTTEEWEEARARADKLLLYFRDAVNALNGVIIGIDDATLQLLLLHAALAGVTQDDDLALIRRKVLPDETGRLVDAVEWIPKSFDTPEALLADAEEEARRRKAAMDVQHAQMSPDAKKAFDRMFRPAAERAFSAGTTHAARRFEADSDQTEEAKALRRQAERLRQEGKL
ncbi:phage gene 29 protein family protein [Mycolicibacterium komossense]|uniref:Tail assembly chaperone n=1 Tax=Mycolicibacterium komossense TaxID=1779 RepID=A0ABT3CMH5_9MYCO|nr:hypothetical protein [Mycolicibacterium komossense]MCV7230660.1 hypothetical protein [Mycolicibacterium komossense]